MREEAERGPKCLRLMVLGLWCSHTLIPGPVFVSLGLAHACDGETTLSHSNFASEDSSLLAEI